MQQTVTVDELKRADAALGNSYRGLSAFERLAQTAVNVLVAKGLVDEGDLRVRLARLAVTLAGDKDRAHPKHGFPTLGSTTSAGCRAGRSTSATTRRRTGRSYSSRSAPSFPESDFARFTKHVALPRSWAMTIIA